MKASSSAIIFALALAANVSGSVIARHHRSKHATTTTSESILREILVRLIHMTPRTPFTNREMLSESLPVSTPVEAPAVVATPNSKPVVQNLNAGTGVSSNRDGKVRYGGINIAGFDFSCDIWGSCKVDGVTDISGSGPPQMEHFVNDLGLNAFRLPVAWQFLVNNNLGGPLDANNFGKYDKLVQGCLDSRAELCIVDM